MVISKCPSDMHQINLQEEMATTERDGEAETTPSLLDLVDGTGV